MNTTHTDMEGDYFSKSAPGPTRGLAWGVAETGFTDKASEVDPQWVQRTYNLLKKYDGMAFTYFNTKLNSIANWALSTTRRRTGTPQRSRTTPTL